MKKKEEMVLALAAEIALRKNELSQEPVETIYFGGGTPSVLSVSDIRFLIGEVYRHHKVVENPEITLEANPDDLTQARIVEFSDSPINRLSIGIQSFFEEDLRLMNRAHNVAQARECLRIAAGYFDNITIDLIYGIPGLSEERWRENIIEALSYGIPHLSSYALTVEPKTALDTFVRKGIIPPPSDEAAKRHFEILVEVLQAHGFIHYELSNFGKPGYFSQNNTAYWLGKKYLGIGPSAHSYDGHSRSWNISSNALYLKAIAAGKLPAETETLSQADRYNEYLMTGLRTIWGVSLQRIEAEFGPEYLGYLKEQAQKFIDDGLLRLEDAVLHVTPKGKFLCDGIASDLFFLNLD